ncbi:uncharacterized protein DEA37_0011458, partial [Paragonimus westermani]
NTFNKKIQLLFRSFTLGDLPLHSQEEYSDLAKKCMDFAVSCIDLCRTSDEVHCLLRGDFDQSTQGLKHPLETVKIAIHSREKKMPLPQALIHRDRGSVKYEVTDILRCPVIKFVGYMVSYVTFLTLITVATFRLDRNDLSESDDNWELRSMEIWSYDFRTSNLVMTRIQIILLFWILGELLLQTK